MSTTRLEINKIRYSVKSMAETIFCNEYFLKLKKNRSIVVYGDYNEDIDSESSDEYLDEVFHRMFFVSSSSSSDDDE